MNAAADSISRPVMSFSLPLINHLKFRPRHTTTTPINHAIVVRIGDATVLLNTAMGCLLATTPGPVVPRGIKAADHFVINLDKMNETAPTNRPQDARRLHAWGSVINISSLRASCIYDRRRSSVEDEAARATTRSRTGCSVINMINDR